MYIYKYKNCAHQWSWTNASNFIGGGKDVVPIRTKWEVRKTQTLILVTATSTMFFLRRLRLLRPPSSSTSTDPRKWRRKTVPVAPTPNGSGLAFKKRLPSTESPYSKKSLIIFRIFWFNQLFFLFNSETIRAMYLKMLTLFILCGYFNNWFNVHFNRRFVIKTVRAARSVWLAIVLQHLVGCLLQVHPILPPRQ